MRQEAFKSIYGTTRKNDFDLSNVINKSAMPSFSEMTKYVYSESLSNMADKTKVINIGNHSLPFAPKTYLEVRKTRVFVSLLISNRC